jgi:2-methylisocitrate lyase-like PEP mutase family enzyme
MISRYEDFAARHRPGAPLLLANAWDAGSAAVIAAAGAPAIATTSSGTAWTNGAPDGGGLGGAALAATVARIVATVAVPVSADIEDGYADLAATVRGVLDAGAVGINLEDRPGGGAALFSVEEQVARIAATRATTRELWINARTDTYLAQIGDPAGRLALTLDRAAAYAAAGADSLFVPGVVDAETIAALVAGPLPLNVMVHAGALPVAELAALGVARVSLGSAVAQAAYAVADRAARELFGPGTFTETENGFAWDALNELCRGDHVDRRARAAQIA